MTNLQLIALIWIFGCLLLSIYTHVKGRKIVNYLKINYLEKWENMGKPQPLYAIPHQKWTLFLSNEEYDDFNDRRLIEMCESQRRLERITNTIIISFFVILGGIALWDTYVN